jgi:flagellar basal body P-ring protein FlgI
MIFLKKSTLSIVTIFALSFSTLYGADTNTNGDSSSDSGNDNDLIIGLNENALYTKKGTTTVANLVRSLQKMGATPKDIIAILESMKSAGSIAADLEVI